MSHGNLFVISGPSGVGKGTVLSKVLEGREDLRFSVSATTRAPRKGEVDGIHYTFMTDACFRGMIDREEFLEYDLHMDASYGTPLAQLEDKLSKGNVLLDVEPKGAFVVKEKRPEAVMVFIEPSSMEELERRLRGRGDTSEEQIQIRLKRAIWEIGQKDRYQYVVVNDDVDRCANEILHIIAQETHD